MTISQPAGHKCELPTQVVTSTLLLLLRFKFLFNILCGFAVGSTTTLALSSIVNVVAIVFLAGQHNGPSRGVD